MSFITLLPKKAFFFKILPVFPSRAVTTNWSSCSRRSSTWLVWLLWWSLSSWWASDWKCRWMFHTARLLLFNDAGAPMSDLLDHTLLFFSFRSSRWSSQWCSVVGSVTALECTRGQTTCNGIIPHMTTTSSLWFWHLIYYLLLLLLFIDQCNIWNIRGVCVACPSTVLQRYDLAGRMFIYQTTPRWRCEIFLWRHWTCCFYGCINCIYT